MNFYNKTVSETLDIVRTTKNGLSSQAAKRRLKRDGLNEVRVAGMPLWKKIIQPFANIMIIILIIAGILSAWQNNTVDAVIIFVIIMASAIVDWAQQLSTSRILKSLREKEIEKIDVVRGGRVLTVPANSLVVGDLILLYEGQKVPADARVVNATNLHVDESMLTGESLSVRKTAAVIRGEKEVYDQVNMLFSGSFIVSGSGQAVVVATANDTEFGKLAKLAGETSMDSPIQKKIDNLVKLVIIAVMVLAAIVFALELARGISPIDALQFVMAFAINRIRNRRYKRNRN